MLITNLKELQSYREFQTTASINLVKTAIINNVAPAGLTQIQTNRFIEQFLNNEWEVVNIPLDRRANPAHGVNRLVYKPNNKIVSYPDERNQLLKDCDYCALPDFPNRENYILYRQELRELPENWTIDKPFPKKTNIINK